MYARLLTVSSRSISSSFPLIAQMTVYDLEESELAYSPLFGAAKSPVNMVGFVAAGLLRGDQNHVYVEDLPKLVHPSFNLIQAILHPNSS